jgi:hypothetical protein
MSSESETNRFALPDAESVEALARRVLELLEPSSVAGRYFDTSAVARMLGVSEEWVRDHAGELGAIRLGDGPRGALRFERDRVTRALDRRRLTPPRANAYRRRSTRLVGGVRLLPLPDAPGAPR